MRRILAITLLIAFGSPLVLPAFAFPTDSQTNLPACCRRNGAHHCTGMVIAGAQNVPAFKAPPCPIYPSPSTPLNLVAASLVASPTPSAEPLIAFAPLAPGQPRVYASIPSSNLKRGPPILLA